MSEKAQPVAIDAVYDAEHASRVIAAAVADYAAEYPDSAG
jgi:hypothetical protein